MLCWSDDLTQLAQISCIGWNNNSLIGISWHGSSQDAAGATQDKASQAAGATQDKANEAGNVAGQKWDQTKQASADTHQASQDKANDAKNAAGNALNQVNKKIQKQTPL
jgi:hypothetical protein